MRDIKFRGKRKDNGEWVEGDLIRYYENQRRFIVCDQLAYTYTECGIDRLVSERYHEVDPATVGQYTGRTAQCTDKIFEHDICIVTRFDHNGADYQFKCVVEWCDGGFAFVNEEKEVFIPLWDVGDTDSDIEVIGNIHQNTELLKGGPADER